MTSNERRITLYFTQKTLQKFAKEDGGLEIVLDVDPTRLENYPQPFEIPLRSAKWDRYPDYNSEFCLIDNIHAAYVNDERFDLLPAEYRAVRALYTEPNHMLDMRQFAVRCNDGADVYRTAEEYNRKVSSTVAYVNKKLAARNVPIRLIRRNGNVVLVTKKIKNKAQK